MGCKMCVISLRETERTMESRGATCDNALTLLFLQPRCSLYVVCCFQPCQLFKAHDEEDVKMWMAFVNHAAVHNTANSPGYLESKRSRRRSRSCIRLGNRVQNCDDVQVEVFGTRLEENGGRFYLQWRQQSCVTGFTHSWSNFLRHCMFEHAGQR